MEVLLCVFIHSIFRPLIVSEIESPISGSRFAGSESCQRDRPQLQPPQRAAPPTSRGPLKGENDISVSISIWMASNSAAANDAVARCQKRACSFALVSPACAHVSGVHCEYLHLMPCNLYLLVERVSCLVPGCQVWSRWSLSAFARPAMLPLHAEPSSRLAWLHTHWWLFHVSARKR